MLHNSTVHEIAVETASLDWCDLLNKLYWEY